MLQKRYYTQVIHSLYTGYPQIMHKISTNSQDIHKLSTHVKNLWTKSYPQVSQLKRFFDIVQKDTESAGATNSKTGISGAVVLMKGEEKIFYLF